MELLTKIGICSLLLISAASFAQPLEMAPEVTSWTTKFTLWLWGPEATLTIQTLNSTDSGEETPTVIHRLLSLFHQSLKSSLVVNVAPLWTSEASKFPSIGIDGILVKADPFHACKKVGLHPDEPTELEDEIDDLLQNTTHPKHHWILIAEEGHCSIANKMENAENGGYSVLLILTDDPTKLENMTEASHLHIFAGKVDRVNGMNLAQNYVYPEPVVGNLHDLRSGQWSVGVYKIVAIVVVIVIIILAIVSITVATCRSVRKRREQREAAEFRAAMQIAIETMPITIWELNQMTKDEKCHVCYGLFNPNDVVRTLPCYHRFHQRCIISRFENQNTECAVCHYQLIPPGLHHRRTTERTPLL